MIIKPMVGWLESLEECHCEAPVECGVDVITLTQHWQD